MSNLLEKASILLTPTAYDDGKILSIKPVQSLGNELVVNGDFLTDTDWSKGTGWTISGGKANVNATSNTDLGQNVGSSVGKTYKITFEVSNYVSGSVKVLLGYGSIPESPALTATANGVYETEAIPNVTNPQRLYISTTTATTNLSINNVSVKELIDADFDFTRNSSATRVNSQGLIEDMQILSGDLVTNGDFSQIGPEQIENGDFATDSDWTKAAGWTISGGTANATSAASGSPLSQYVDVGKTYKITYDVVSLSQGAFQVDLSFSGTALGQLVTTTGTFTDFITSINPALSIRAVGTTTGSITNVSAKEVGQDWSLGAGWSIGEGKVIGSSASGTLSQAGIASAGKQYKVTFSVTDYSSGTLFVDIGGSSAQTTTSNGLKTFYFTSTSTGSLRFYGGSFTGSIDNVSVIEITDDTNLPRIDYSPYSGAGTCGHWLFEPQSTNLIPYSEDYTVFSPASNGTGINPVITSNYSVSPDGTQNADRIQFNRGSGTSSIDTSYVTYGLSLGTIDSTLSIYLKTNDGTTKDVTLRLGASLFDYDVTVTSNWQRFTLSGNTSVDRVQILLYGNQNSQTADISCYGTQVEEQSYATSYIPTSGSTVTRLQDAANEAGSIDLINSTEGVLYAEIASFISTDATEPNRYITITNGTSNERIALLLGGNTNQLRAIAFSNTQSINISFTTSSTDAKQFNKLAIKYKSGDYAFFLNGVKIGGSTEANIFTTDTLNDLSFDVGGGTQKFRGKVKCVAVYKEALTDAELTCLTTI